MDEQRAACDITPTPARIHALSKCSSSLPASSGGVTQCVQVGHGPVLLAMHACRRQLSLLFDSICMLAWANVDYKCWHSLGPTLAAVAGSTRIGRPGSIGTRGIAIATIVATCKCRCSNSTVVIRLCACLSCRSLLTTRKQAIPLGVARACDDAGGADGPGAVVLLTACCSESSHQKPTLSLAKQPRSMSSSQQATQVDNGMPD